MSLGPKVHHGGGNRQRPAVRHGIAGIQRQVQDGILELSVVGEYRRNVLIHMDMDGNVLAQGSAQHVAQIGNQMAQVQGFGVQILPSREGEQAFGQRGTAFDRPQNRVGHRLQAFVPIGQQVADQFGIGHDDRENVVEVVRDAAGQLADGLHLLSLAKMPSMATRAVMSSNTPSQFVTLPEGSRIGETKAAAWNAAAFFRLNTTSPRHWSRFGTLPRSRRGYCRRPRRQ